MIMVAVCMLILHSPDGTALLVDSDTFTVRQIDPRHQDHVAKGTNSVIYLNFRPNGFGVKETIEQISDMIRKCENK